MAALEWGKVGEEGTVFTRLAANGVELAHQTQSSAMPGPQSRAAWLTMPPVPAMDAAKAITVLLFHSDPWRWHCLNTLLVCRSMMNQFSGANNIMYLENMTVLQ